MNTPRPNEPQAQSNAPAAALEPEQPDLPDQQLPDVMGQVNDFNSESRVHEDQYSRTRRLTDQVGQSAAAARIADMRSANADLDHKAIQAENPDRAAPRLRQWLVALAILGLDAVACYFAAEALGGSPSETLAWAGLFLALLGAGEVTLDLYREAHSALWRWTAFILAAFITLLGVLRFWFLAIVGAEGLVTAGVGAILFTVATGGFVAIGYRVLRVAETNSAWQARRKARAAAAAAASAHRRLDRLIDKRNGLARTYLSLIRTRLVKSTSAAHLASVERAIWAHLTGEEQS